MERNVGGYDRIGRLVFGAVLVVVGVAGYAGVVGLAVGPVSAAQGAVVVTLVGLVLLVTGYLRQCPIWSVVGVDTARRG